LGSTQMHLDVGEEDVGAGVGEDLIVAAGD
jgi:hypothetical protein